MITPQELRIGNYVNGELYETGCSVTVLQYKVKSLGEKSAVLQDLKTQSVLNYQDIQPIPLTSKWLLKFGFTQSLDYDPRKRFDKVPLYENNGVSIMLSDSEFWYVTRQYDGGSSDPFERVLEVKSVHQVQNLYFALTGEELTINE